MDDLLNSFENSIFDPTLDLSMDVADLSADFLGAAGFPLLGFLVKTGKEILAVREQILLRKTYITAQAFAARTIDPKKLEKYRKKLKDPQYAAEEVGRLLELIDKSTELKKCSILGKILRHYINEELSFDRFYELTEALNRIFLPDHAILISALRNGGVGMESYEGYRLDRLISVGLLENKDRFGNFKLTDGHLIQQKNDCTLTPLGELYCRYGLEL